MLKSTPVHEHHNPDLLSLIPPHARRIVEVGCSSGALAREVKKTHPGAHYTGIDIEAAYVEMARPHCDRVVTMDIEHADAALLERDFPADCWIFGDVLEHLRDPWQTLANIRKTMPAGGCVIACIPNTQHWSLQARLSMGDFRYEETGLLDRTHIRFFTRLTMLEMFDASGFHVEAGLSRIAPEPQRATFLPLIGAMAAAAGMDPQSAMDDATPIQYVFRAVAA